MNKARKKGSGRREHMAAARKMSAVTMAAGIGWRVLTGDPTLFYSGCLVWAVEWAMSPDRDLNTFKVSLSPRGLWSLYWKPFSYGVPHRSRWSHSLLLGTPARIVYISLPVALALVFWAWLGGADLAYWWAAIQVDPVGFARWFWEWANVAYWPFRVFAIAALISDATHLFNDGLFKFWKVPVWVPFVGRLG